MAIEFASLGGATVWVDAQLPPALARWLRDEYGVTAEHVDRAGHLGADDPSIFAAARASGAAVVVTKDDDFVGLLERHGPPPRRSRPRPPARARGWEHRLQPLGPGRHRVVAAPP